MDLSRIRLFDSEPLDDAYLRLIDDLRTEGAAVYPLERFNAQPWLAPHLRIIAFRLEERLFFLVVRAQRWTDRASWVTARAVTELRQRLGEGDVTTFAHKFTPPPPASWILPGTPESRFAAAVFGARGKALTVANAGAVAQAAVTAARVELGEQWDLDDAICLGDLDAYTLSQWVEPPAGDQPLGIPSGLYYGLGTVVGEVLRRVAPEATVWERAPAEPGDARVLQLRVRRDWPWYGHITCDERELLLLPFELVEQRYCHGERAESYTDALAYLHDFLAGRRLNEVLRPRR